MNYRAGSLKLELGNQKINQKVRNRNLAREKLYEKSSISSVDSPPNILDYRIRFLSYYIKQNHKTLLDVSCGWGNFLKYFKWKGLEVEGTEIDDDKIKKCEEKGIKCKKVDLNNPNLKLPYEDNSFDIVSCTEVIEHIKNPKIVIEELIRVSKYLVLITTPKGKSYYSPEHVNFWNEASELSNLFEEYNYEINQILTKAEDYPMKQRCFVVAVWKKNTTKNKIKEKCPICNGVFKTKYFKDLMRCKKCGLFRKENLPSKEYLKDRLKNFLLSACFNEKKFNRRLKKAHDQLDFIEYFANVGKLFDIGCGPGFFLKAAEDRGWEVEGNDIGQSCVKFAKETFNINVSNKFIDEIDLGKEKYDVIVIWNALEHLLDPISTLNKAYAALKYGGFIHIRVPDREKRKIEDKYEPDHMYEFGYTNLAQLLEKIGFKPVKELQHDGEVDLFYCKEFTQ